MSEAITLSDLLKTSQQVTSLANPDSLVAVDQNGNPKRISKTDLTRDVKSGDATSPQWIRLFEMQNTGTAIFEFSANYNHNAPSSYLMHCFLADIAICKMSVISAIHLGSARVFDKIRIVYVGSKYYFDVHYTPNATNNVRVVCYPGFRILTPLLENNAEIPSGATSKEFVLSELGGKALSLRQLQNRSERRAA